MSLPICIIPARMGSSRYPGKPLVHLNGLPLVLHVYERCRLFAGFSDIVVATCDEEIREVVENHGGEVVMTSRHHERATDRVQEAVELLRPDMEENNVVMMIQGDELLVEPGMISEVLEAQKKSGARVVNFGSRLEPEDHKDPNTVKLVAAPDGNILYFSRAPIPSMAQSNQVHAYQQTGIMAFTFGFLVWFAKQPQTPLEIIESVDMLRVLEHGLTIQVVLSQKTTLGVDTPADRERGEYLLKQDPFTDLYLDIGQ